MRFGPYFKDQGPGCNFLVLCCCLCSFFQRKKKHTVSSYLSGKWALFIAIGLPYCDWLVCDMLGVGVGQQTKPVGQEPSSCVFLGAEEVGG